MSAITPTQSELLYAFYGASTNLATFTAEDNLMKTYPVCALPSLRQLLDTTGKRASSLKVKARGQLGTTGTPTFTFTLRLIPATETWSAGGIILGASGAVLAGSTVTLSPWKLEAEIGLVTLPAAAVNATVKTMGDIGGAAFSPAQGSIPANNVSPLLSTVDLSAQYYLWISAACSASSSLNLINMQMLKVYGEN
jgi:hypothetical protein